MKSNEIKQLVPMQVLRRSGNYPTIVVVGPTGSGKSTLIYALINHRIVAFMQLGIGESSQTTIIPANIVFDERIKKEEYFALRVKVKRFSIKDVDIELVPLLADVFFTSDRNKEETLEALDDEWFQKVLEPESTRYHMGSLFSDAEDREVFLNKLKDALEEPLNEMEWSEDLDEKIAEFRKASADSKVKPKIIKRRAFEEVFRNLDTKYLEDYVEYLSELGFEIMTALCRVLGVKLSEISNGFEAEFSAVDNDIYPFGGDILKELFDSKAPYSLVVDEITLVCRPRREMLEAHNEKWPMRFILRDTMGLNQIGIDGGSIKDALEVAIATNPDAILFLLSLEEREDVIAEACRTIQERCQRKNDTAIPKNIIFTKPDRFISNIINRESRETVELTQNDYINYIDEATSKVDKKIESIVNSFISPSDYTWLSLRYLEEGIDPIQLALKERESEKLARFKPEGLYDIMTKHVDDIQIRRLPSNLKEAPFVTVKNDELPAIEISLSRKWYKDIQDDIIKMLTEDKAIVNGYTITTKYRISGRSVVAYYSRLKVGLGHTTNAKVFGNFSINMKGLMKLILRKFIGNIDVLYDSMSISTRADNISKEEVDKLVEFFDKDDSISSNPLSDANPDLINMLDEKTLAVQKLHKAFKVYFEDPYRFLVLMDKVGFRLSYGNEEIKEMIDSIYIKPISYDATIREMQLAYKKLFGQQHFLDIITDEIGKAMTDMINDMFVIM